MPAWCWIQLMRTAKYTVTLRLNEVKELEGWDDNYEL